MDFPILFFLFLSILPISQSQELSVDYYKTSCPNFQQIVRETVTSKQISTPTTAAATLRMFFHDCMVEGCDASVLISSNTFNVAERDAEINLSLPGDGFDVVVRAKTALELTCPKIVSCADILAVAARDASVAVGGPSWTVKLGRRDSTTASRTLANANLPSFTASLESLISQFRNKGLSERDMVALSGAHTIGQAQCLTFRNRIYSNGSDIDAGFATIRRRRCPADPNTGNGNLAPLDLVTPNSFDNNYFRNLLQRKGLLHSDQVLFSGGSTDSIVNEYSSSPSTFSSDFASAMVRMGDIEPLTGSQGQIRRLCRVVN
ncbi:lignin-forming anionic peroxidase [Jatropha curcas]|uniref:lignin-forming anionic peroxidase n=1 Tax=Jatropha curcas TaxID=180498 RepID=UPI001895C143|nr:lignin-forming anionic peroxidase [Jatropha curcas]